MKKKEKDVYMSIHTPYKKKEEKEEKKRRKKYERKTVNIELLK